MKFLCHGFGTWLQSLFPGLPQETLSLRETEQIAAVPYQRGWVLMAVCGVSLGLAIPVGLHVGLARAFAAHSVC